MSAHFEYGVQYSDSLLIRVLPDMATAEAEARAHNTIDKSSWWKPFEMAVVTRTVTDWAEVAE